MQRATIASLTFFESYFWTKFNALSIHQYIMHKVAVNSTAHLFHIKLQSATNEINTRHFFRLFLTNICDSSSFICLNNNLICSSGSDHSPAQTAKAFETSGSGWAQLAHRPWLLSLLLVTASLYWEDFGRHFLRRFLKIHIHFLPVSAPPRWLAI